MDLENISPEYQAFVKDLLERYGFDPLLFISDIPERDEMFFKGVVPGYPGRLGAAFYRYVESALRTHTVYRQLAESLGGLEGLKRVLDFGSGYGRLTRTLVQQLPPSRIWACDIYAEAVAWQAETFGVNGLVSVSDPDRFALAEQHDIVFSASVFSHLPDGLFQRWLARLYDLVAPEGLLAFSVHGAAFAPDGQPIAESGIGFAPWSESETLDPAIYGMSYVTADYIRGAISQACGDAAAENSRVFPRALFESQDLIVVPGRDCQVSDLDVCATPIGSFRPWKSDAVAWEGWVLDPNPGHSIESAQLFVGASAVSAMRPTEHDLEVMRFFPGSPNPALRWRFDRVEASAGTLLRVEFTSTTGARAYCYATPSRDPDHPPLLS